MRAQSPQYWAESVVRPQISPKLNLPAADQDSEATGACSPRDLPRFQLIHVLTSQQTWRSPSASPRSSISKLPSSLELFFKAIKQNLKIKTFLGTSANAVHTQIWTALIAMLVLRYLQLKSTFGWSLSNLVAMLRLQLFVYRDLHTWLDCPFEAPPALDGIHDAQLVLNLAR